MERSNTNPYGGRDRTLFLLADRMSMNRYSGYRWAFPMSGAMAQAPAAGYSQALSSLDGRKILPTIDVIGRLEVKKIKWLTGDTSRIFLAGCR